MMNEVERMAKRKKEYWCYPQKGGHPVLYFHGHQLISHAEYIHAVGPDDCDPHVGNNSIFSAREHQLIHAQLPASHSSRYRLALRAAIAKEIRRLIRQIFRLHVHIEPATEEQHRDRAHANHA